MSRLIVKNLPPYADTQRLRQHFERRDGPGGTITDVKVAMKPDGTTSRGFGFIGFKTEKEAQAARGWFDRTYLGSSRINVALVDVRTRSSYTRMTH
jgi:multiple RNA-binding domain-containing protein 1